MRAEGAYHLETIIARRRGELQFKTELFCEDLLDGERFHRMQCGGSRPLQISSADPFLRGECLNFLTYKVTVLMTVSERLPVQNITPRPIRREMR
jgi:hypothetical protein